MAALKSTDFGAAGVLSEVAANAILYDGWRDKTGSIYKTTGSPSRLNQNGGGGAHFYHASLASIASVRIILFLDGPANTSKVLIRGVDDGTGKPTDIGYYAIFTAASISTQAYFASIDNRNIQILGWGGLTGPVVVVVDVVGSGTANITTLRVRACSRANWNAVTNAADNLGSVTWAVDDSTNDDATSGPTAGQLQGAGWADIANANGIEQVHVYDLAEPLSRGRVTRTYHDDVEISLDGVVTGGVQPVTLRWHAMATDIPYASNPIAVNSSTEVAGQSGFGSATLDYTFTDELYRLFVLKATDSTSPTPVVTFSNFLRAKRGRQPQHHIFIGDSYTEGSGSWRAPDAFLEAYKAYFGTSTLTRDNRGRSQSEVKAWLPLADPDYDDMGLSPGAGGYIGQYLAAVAAARSANPNAKIILHCMFGINDSNNANSPSTAPSPATFVARYERMLDAMVNPGTLADVAYIHHPSFCATQIPGDDGSTGGTGSRRAYNMSLFMAAADALANGTTIKIGDRNGWFDVAAEPDQIEYPVEGHPNISHTDAGTATLPDGNRDMGNRWALATAIGEGLVGASSSGAPSIGSSPLIRGL